MKKIAGLVTGTILMLTAVIILADDGHSQIDDVMARIRAEAGVSENSEIEADRVSDALLEELGEALMSERHPDPEVHEWMDRMMGGEGSDSLALAHRRMGYNYLSGAYCCGGGRGRGMMYGGRFNSRSKFYRGRSYRDSLDDILKERYENGEITKEQYDRMVEELNK